MNENLQNALVEIINKAISGIDASTAFMQAELPEVIEQLLIWYASKSLIMSVIGVLMILALVKLDSLVFKLIKEREDCDFGDIVIFYVCFFSLVRSIYLLPISMVSLDWLQIWIAPKIWLIEYAADLVK